MLYCVYIHILCIYTHIVYIYTYCSQYRDAGREKEIKVFWKQ